MRIDLKIIMNVVHNANKANKNYFGFLLLMSNVSKFQLGALNAQSFVDRINLAAKLIITKEKFIMFQCYL